MKFHDVGAAVRGIRILPEAVAAVCHCSAREAVPIRDTIERQGILYQGVVVRGEEMDGPAPFLASYSQAEQRVREVAVPSNVYYAFLGVPTCSGSLPFASTYPHLIVSTMEATRLRWA